MLLAVHNASPDWAMDVIEPGVDALVTLSRQLDTPRAETAQAAALLVSEVLEAHDRRDVLHRAWMPRLANSGIFARRGLELLASPDLVDFNGHDTTIQTGLLGCPHGLGVQEMELFHRVGALHLPDSPWPALEMVELLQRAGRWVDASAFAQWALNCIPNTPEHAARRHLAGHIASLAASEEAVVTGASLIPMPTPAQDDPPQLVAILRRAKALADARHLLSECATPSGPAALETRAMQLVTYADAMAAADDQTAAVATEHAWQLAAAGLRGVAALLRWDAEIQRSIADPERPHAIRRTGRRGRPGRLPGAEARRPAGPPSRRARNSGDRHFTRPGRHSGVGVGRRPPSHPTRHHGQTRGDAVEPAAGGAASTNCSRSLPPRRCTRHRRPRGAPRRAPRPYDRGALDGVARSG